MTFIDAYSRTNDWKRKIVLVSMFHKTKLGKDRTWTIRKTAAYFKISNGLVSENIKLNGEWDKIQECKSRNQALLLVRNGNAE